MGRSSWRKLGRVTAFRQWRWWQKATTIGSVVLLMAILIVPLPSPLFNNAYTTTLRASNGQLLSAAIAEDEQWRFPPSDSIPYKFATAIRVYEDEYFYYHPGINPIAILRALKQNFMAGKIVSGGSTISMQTVRMAYLNQPRTYGQKLKEILATLKLELFYSKEDILKTYADNAPFGGNIVGLSAASWRYFGLPPHQLSWAEAATLAVLPNNPGAVYPGKNSTALLTKRNFLLTKLQQAGYFSRDDLFLAQQEKLPDELISLPNLAYHLLHRAMQEGHKGENLITTLDARLQPKVTNLVNRHSAAWAGNQVYNAAAIIIEVKSGKMLAYVGNTSNSGQNGQHVDIITAQRSPGSLLKPILFAAALDAGLILPTELLPDIPLFYKGFAPQNFDRQYRGAVPANQALISSLNVPFVHLLIEYGYEKFHHKLKQLGLRSLNRPASHYGLSLILGGAESTLDELTATYAGLARAYLNYRDRPFNSGYAAEDYYANYYLQEKSLPTPTLTKTGNLNAASIGFAFEAMQALIRPDQEAGWQQFSSSRPVAWKTGTSFGLRDGWAIGVTGNYVVGVWMGNADGEGRPGLTGIQAAAPLMFKIFELLPAEENFIYPQGAPISICRQSGMRASAICPDTQQLNVPDYLEQTKTCTYHHLIHLDQTKKYQVNSNCYEVSKMVTQPWFTLPPVMAWYYRKYHPEYQKPPAFAANCGENSFTLFGLIYPRQFTNIKIPVEQDGQPGKVVFEAAHQDKSAILYWHLDNRFIGKTEGHHQMGIQTTPGPHRLTIVDTKGNEVSQMFQVIK